MENNPDIRVADSRREEAESELNRVRLDVARKVITLVRSISGQRHEINRMHEPLQKKPTSAEQLQQQSRSVLVAKKGR